MKLLVTGACGHIGSYIVHNIHKIKKIKEVLLLDNFSTLRYSSLFNINNNKKFKFYNIDLSREELEHLPKVHYIIHCASHTNAEGSFKIKNEMYRNNLNCLKNIIKYCKKKKSKLIHISSTSVYGKQTEIVNEDDNSFLKPQSPYAEIKLIEEKLLKKNKKKLKYITLRFGTIAGISKGMRFHTAINKFCFDASLNKKIHIYKTALNQYRPYLSIKDAFKTFKFCIEKEVFDNNIYNILSGNFTVRQILEIIKEYKRKISIKFVKSEIMNQLSYHVDNKKMKKLGLKLNSSIKIDIKQTLELFKNLNK